ncbi:MAG: DUF4149 domain-containing protein [Nitrospirae bacterium]|nr:MAG: DUF4149 domain-containing protein [Nitrospirota bacterium]
MERLLSMVRGRKWAFFLALLELLGLVCWVGGLALILVAIIPSVFTTMNMELGGQFLRKVFERYNTLTGGVVLLLVVTTAYRAWMSREGVEGSHVPPVPRREWILLAMLGVMTGAIVLVIDPYVATLQHAAFSAQSEQEKHVAYEAFFRVHVLIRALHLLNGGLALGLLVVKFHQWTHPQEMSGRKPRLV